MAFRTVTELPDSMVDDDAVEEALMAAFGSHALRLIGAVGGETRSRLYKSTGRHTTSEGYVADKETLYIEFHQIFGDRWACSTALGASTTGTTGNYTLVGRSPLKVFNPLKNTTVERSIIASNGGIKDAKTDATLQHNYLFDAEDGTDTAATEDLTPTGTVTYAQGSVGRALNLNGLDETNYMAGTGTQLALFSSSDWSVDFFFYSDSIPSANLFGNDELSGSSLRWGFRLSSGNLNFDSEADAVSSSFATGLIRQAWNHVAIRQSGGTLDFYINGSFGNTLTASYASTPTGNFRLGDNPLFTGPNTIDSYVDGFRIWNKQLSPTEIEDFAASGIAAFNEYEQPTVVEIATHNTTFNPGNGSFNYAATGRLTQGAEPYITTLSAAATATDTDVQLTDAIFADMDPNQNNSQAQKIWITDLTNATQEEVTITSTTAFGLSQPTVDPLANSFPIGSLVSDFPYRVMATDLSNDGTVKLWSESDQANLQQSFNENYEGTPVNVASTGGVNEGYLPFVRCHGKDPAYVQANVVHKERQDLNGGFENRRLFHPASIIETTDGSGNTTTVLQVAGASFPDMAGYALEVTSGPQTGATGIVLSNTATTITLTAALPGSDAEYDAVSIDVLDDNIYSLPRGV